MNIKKQNLAILLGLSLLSLAQFSYADELSSEFKLLDQNNNGYISYDEYFVIMMREEATTMQLEFYDADQDKDGYISLDEAVVWDVEQEDFEQADIDHSGLVDRYEFSHAMLDYIYNEIDLNEDRLVDMVEFSKASEG